MPLIWEKISWPTGKNYDAAIISSGYAGLALGATPTAIANITAVPPKYGASPLAFVMVPLVGAFLSLSPMRSLFNICAPG
ncbi:sodium/glutamate symporter [Thalassomonas actiniarum]|uniref:sodium/glutamate symporter n=1 Tax=Thalassomonas actiniarum TaxID=485447 RepID=UPI001F1D0764|nr:sodium/glutamate symporter [Thalassomonas actiniarum]